jgi:hypothetical protein
MEAGMRCVALAVLAMSALVAPQAAADPVLAAPIVVADDSGAIPGTARKGGQPGNYGDVDYADPGFQPDGKKRYPIDTVGRIRAAWRYINQTRNAARYTDEQLSRVKAGIIAAWKRKIDDNGPPGAPAP